MEHFIPQSYPLFAVVCDDMGPRVGLVVAWCTERAGEPERTYLNAYVSPLGVVPDKLWDSPTWSPGGATDLVPVISVHVSLDEAQQAAKELQ